MIRKKQLRAANVKLAVELGETKAELADVKAHRDVLSSENGQLIDANVDMANRLSVALNANAGLAQRLRHFTDVFGEAFVKGGELPAKTGPSRPNRKKLTEADAKDIRNAFYGGAKQKDLARNYGVNPATISRVVRGIYH
ncbi:HTH DNA binding protein [Mycobacterium phage Bactobuster]|uniref:HTH DNA binding protein n=2 Tax=Pukovnikvirus TaxID=2948873 RepID=A0A127KPX7_9CAUD|nr:HTH DNA binding protein [Mycobacterium phage Bactobuster]YP_010064322.1 HTH DNA binding protein [Mycobacterium phage Phaded]AMO44014.1 HTH DNA binding protein [Mycobacterium phage Bactobuster]QGZ16848.1 helix-turn-helix DNA binding domain protein [Mycobacterium phage Phaded]